MAPFEARDRPGARLGAVGGIRADNTLYTTNALPDGTFAIDWTFIA